MTSYTNLLSYREALKSDYCKKKKIIIFFTSIAAFTFLFWCFELYLHNKIIIEGRSLTVQLILSSSPNQAFRWFESIMIIFNMIWPIVNTVFFCRIMLETRNQRSDVLEKIQYANGKIIEFEKHEEDLPRKDFYDLYDFSTSNKYLP